MKIQTHRVVPYLDTSVVHGDVHIDLGLLNDDERRELASVLREGADRLCEGLDESDSSA